MKQAELDIEANKRILLNEEEGKRFLDLLSNPPEPTQALKDLFKNDKDSVDF